MTLDARVRWSEGRTLPLGNYATARVDVALEVDVPSGLTVDEAKKEIQEKVAAWLSDWEKEHSGFKHATQAPSFPGGTSSGSPNLPSPAPTPTATGSEVPELDPSFLDTFPWKAFASGKGEWVFANTEGAEVLREELAQAEKKTLIIGKHRYRLSGDQDRFLQRFPTEGQR